MNSKLKFIVVISLLFAAIGCDSSSPTGDTTQKDTQGASTSPGGKKEGSTSVCSLVSKDEASSIMNQKVVDTETGYYLNVYEGCRYKTEDYVMTPSTYSYLGTIVMRGDSKKFMQDDLDVIGSLNLTPEPVSDLGEEAYFGPASSLYVRQKDALIKVFPPLTRLKRDAKGNLDPQLGTEEISDAEKKKMAKGFTQKILSHLFK